MKPVAFSVRCPAMLSWAIMRRVRRHVARIAGGWLLFQASVLSLTSVSLCAGMIAAAAAQSCTCAHGDGQECPMHPSKPTSKSSCSCRSTNDSTTAALVSLVGPVAVLARAASIVAPSAISTFQVTARTSPAATPVAPDPPPPRA
jgi:hypothetical protein